MHPEHDDSSLLEAPTMSLRGALWVAANSVCCLSSGSYKDLEGVHNHDDFDVTLVVCHNAAPFEEQSDGERHLLR